MKYQQETNIIVAGTNQDTEIAFGVSKYVEIVCKREKFTEEDGLQIDNSKAECCDSDTAEHNKSFDIKEGDGKLDRAKKRAIKEYFSSKSSHCVRQNFMKET